MNRFALKRLSFRVLALLLALLTLLPFVSCQTTEGETTSPVSDETTTDAEPAAPELNCTVRLLPFTEPVSIHTEGQAGFLSDSTDSVSKYADGNQENSAPQPIVLQWEVESNGEGEPISHFIVRIWMQPDQSDAKRYRVLKSARKFTLENVYVGERYYWDVTAYGASGAVSPSGQGTFITEAQPPRNLKLSGVTNVRDLGGWTTEDGGRIRQGLLFRGARLNSGKTSLITPTGVDTARKELGILTEIDLRTPDATGGITASVLGSGTNYYNRPLNKDNLYKDEDNLAMVKQIFALLADEENYPIYFHCSIGTDRTGMIAFLVGGLLGMSEEDLWRDFLFSNFGEIQGPRSKSNMQSFVTKVKSKSGASLAQKVYSYLNVDLKVPASDLDAVIRILKIAPGKTEIPPLSPATK